MIEMYLLNKGVMQRYELRNRREAMELVKSVPRLDMIKKINQKINGVLCVCKLFRDEYGDIQIQWPDEALEKEKVKEIITVCDNCPLLDVQLETCRLDMNYMVKSGMVGEKFLVYSTNCELQLIKYGDKTIYPEKIEITY